MQTFSKDAQGFIKGVTAYLSSDISAPSLVPRVATLLHKVSAQAKKERHARVFSAVPLNDDEKQNINRLLRNLLGHAIEIENTVDKHIIGGLRIQVADWILDTSLLYQLTDMTAVRKA